MIYCELNKAKEYVENKMKDQFNKLHLENKMDFPDVTWKKLGKRTAGLAYNRSGKIQLNTDYLQSKDWQKFLDETPLHELAHIVAYKLYHTSGHDKNWKRVCYAFGLDGSRCHSFAAPDNARTYTRHAKTYKATCKCGIHHELSSVRYRRMLDGTKYICAVCHSRLVLE